MELAFGQAKVVVFPVQRDYVSRTVKTWPATQALWSGQGGEPAGFLTAPIHGLVIRQSQHVAGKSRRDAIAGSLLAIVGRGESSCSVLLSSL